MKTIRLRSWAGIARALKRLESDYGTYERQFENGETYKRRIGFLFRGQADERWKLETTLERRTAEEFDVEQYVLRATRAAHELESFTGARWQIPTFPELQRQIKSESDTFKVHLPAYDFLVYLRHHGYPSPLLDWTESPYVAAYFAYATARTHNPAVYCYIERPALVKGGRGGDPMISVKGPFVTTDKRHFAQKAWYTIATRWDYKTERHVFCPHEHVFARGDRKQDLLVKIVLPVRDRAKAIRQLDKFNINHFTLFQSEDALVKAIESKHFDLDV